MKRIAAIVMLLAGLFAGTAAQAGPGDDCLAVRQSGNDALNAHDVNRIMSHYFRDVIYFSSAQNELIVGTDMLRAFFTKLPTTVKVEMGQVLATQPVPNVIVCSGYQTVVTPNRRTLTRISMTLVNINGAWLIAEQHVSAYPNPQ